MKVLLSMLTGFLITLSAFAGGAVYATAILAVKTTPAPSLDINASTAWSSEAITIAAAPNDDDGTVRDREPDTAKPIMDADVATPPPEELDATLVAGEPEEAAGILDVSVRSPQHQAWCASRYRSYDADSDRYRTYRGETRFCVSPYGSGEQDRVASSADLPEEPVIADAVLVEVSEADDYVQSCAARYR